MFRRRQKKALPIRGRASNILGRYYKAIIPLIFHGLFTMMELAPFLV
jgi:hypothetical protein